MAQINVTLDQDEILRLLADSSGGAFRQVLAAALDAVMRAESDEQLGAGRYERSESRTDGRNGTRAPAHDPGRHHRARGPQAPQRPVQDDGLRELQEERGRSRDHDGRDGGGRRLHRQGRQGHA